MTHRRTLRNSTLNPINATNAPTESHATLLRIALRTLDFAVITTSSFGIELMTTFVRCVTTASAAGSGARSCFGEPAYINSSLRPFRTPNARKGVRRSDEGSALDVEITM